MPRRPAFYVQAAREAIRVLQRHGIDDGFRVKLHPVMRGCLAQYRSNSQFKHNGALIWLAPNHPRGAVLVDTFLHEYGHIIYEYARARDPVLFHELLDSVTGGEEDFAESFAHALTGRWPDGNMLRIARLFGDALRGEHA